uniref:Putative PIF1 DNA helicase/replication protein A1-like protein n=1 Tax=Tanacetum cinerariifolium TaxID=118510 RepID=A0A699RY35_TANCI|nr:putative PIF1 DNA helicase/replication protein A1-like protein [Tanacetum cinerariifolium]GFC90267.1 putative PIF1 DNA helicase/replication protein A1-like protein [Tanacetum cinerariifolium]
MLDSINPLVKDFRIAGERIKSSDDKILNLKLIGTRKRDGRDYNLPTASEVAALNVGDFNSTKNNRDIILHCQDGDFMRISKLHPSYLVMQYPLCFPYAEDGNCTDIFHYGVIIKKQRNARYKEEWRYNLMFAFTSMAGHQDTSVNVGRGPYCYSLHGENYHLAGSLLPKTGKPPKFAQLYIYDTDNEITN